MSELVEIVDSLENKVSKLLHRLELLQQTNSKLKTELETAQKENIQEQQIAKEWEEKYKPFRGFIPKCWDCSKKERLEEEKKKAIRNKLNVLSDTKLTNAQYLTIVPNSNNPLMQAKIGFPELSQN